MVVIRELILCSCHLTCQRVNERLTHSIQGPYDRFYINLVLLYSFRIKMCTVKPNILAGKILWRFAHIPQYIFNNSV